MSTVKDVLSVRGPLQPVAWGKDELSVYLESAHRNRLATFANKQDRYAQLLAIDSCFADVSREWRNPSQPIVALLFIRTHGSYRAACEAAMAGAVVEAFIMVRAMLEAAGYAAHIHRNPELEEVWLRRHDTDPDVAKAANNAFKVSDVRTSIERGDRASAKRFHRLYNEAIDFGAHPNERAIIGNMTEAEVPEGTRFEQRLLQDDGLPMDYALITTARAGLCSLDILRLPYDARFMLLGIKGRVLALRRGL